MATHPIKTSSSSFLTTKLSASSLHPNMVQSKKYRGVRQRQWGSWVSEIRHPLLKKRIWLGTFETADAAARAYDQAAVLMSGQNAKTNFATDAKKPMGSDELRAKVKKSCTSSLAPSVTCLRLDNDSSNIGVWQKRAGRQSESRWVMKVDLNKSKSKGLISNEGGDHGMDEENRVALQMVEELLYCNGGKEVCVFNS